VRLFAAVPLSDAIRDRLAVHVAALRADAGDQGIRWVPAEQWHLTLAFYGEVPAAAAGRLADRLARVAGRTPPLLLLLGAGLTFGGRSRGQVLALRVGGATPESTVALGRLADRCRAAPAGGRASTSRSARTGRTSPLPAGGPASTLARSPRHRRTWTRLSGRRRSCCSSVPGSGPAQRVARSTSRSGAGRCRSTQRSAPAARTRASLRPVDARTRRRVVTLALALLLLAVLVGALT
jgi:2'-5' RNA ligase